MIRIITAGFAAVALLMTVAPAAPVAQAASSETYRQLNLFGDVFERVRSDYVEEVSDKELIESAIKGMLSSLDPHSSYLNREGFEDMRVETKGEFGGLGIEVTMENGLVKVISPIDDTPAAKAGVKAGDFITHLDGEQVLGLTLSEAVDRMRGLVGTEIVLMIRREGVEQPIETRIVRAIIKIQSIKARIEENAAYIRITKFNEQAEVGLIRELGKIKEQLGDTMTGVILDLRNNPGGLLDQAIAVSDAFLDQGEIVSTRGRRTDSVQRFNAKSGDLADCLPIVVLINGGSASASEIVAGALQDHGRAIILGTRSFGKGSVQTIIPLSGHGAIRLTTARYYTPSGSSIQAKGIEPDIEVIQGRIETEEQNGQRDEASLRNRLASEEEINGDSPEGNSDEAEAEVGNGRSELAQKDFQLSRALDLLHGLSLFNDRVVN
ncbi:MAG: S41 family peptidase [Proteobacteria bacterium]|nr:S41 family peptidase [Pseudomonadota bacterium]